MLEGRDWTGLARASPGEIAALRAVAPIPLPAAYVALLELSNGGEGALPTRPGYFCLYPASETAQIARDGDFHAHFPGLFVIGGNGGGEAIAIDAEDPGHRIVYFDMTNINPMESVASLAANFEAFVDLIGLE
ncbi:SMI1/KNR4 family protein [Sphingomonas sp. Sphisp140]|uniref:SMI1/KNR4 family protein n=1 Tax=unclassified Sphingomonas TaxID=196159 RepID=UPI0039AEE51F